MFVALRELRAARGRFLLITLVVVLVAVLVSFLSGLTAGLGHQNISALQRLHGQVLVFADNGSTPSFDASALTADQVRSWQQAGTAEPVGIGRTQAVRTGEHVQDVAAKSAAPAPGFGSASPQPVVVIGTDGTAFGYPAATPGSVILSAPAAKKLDATTGDHVSIGGTTLTVAAVGGDDWFGHGPVVWTSLADQRAADPAAPAATVLVTSGIADPAAVAAGTHTTTVAVSDAPTALSSYQAEHSSLTLMTVLLLAISALMIGAFFVVWTMQRTADIATLKALGATTRSLVRDSLGQALLVLVTGSAVGVGVTALASRLMGDSMPFVLDASTTLQPAVLLTGLGALGAAAALRFLASADPLAALGRSR
ncbi:ABC transporter permease [Nocardia stercoris]|uniref:ABC transporter permease n=1 Tax=Nocardia stercoris TaxID=2483361 RepID=A0A3M2L2Z1_9NOCA|nr:ABC transporter permease [Nocardia stercoris]RMI31060.1 ABC transporter permease [Nocardia stercoris]